MKSLSSVLKGRARRLAQAGMVLAAVAAVTAGVPSPAMATHLNYCGHGASPSIVHASYNYRAVVYFQYSTNYPGTGEHVHTYEEWRRVYVGTGSWYYYRTYTKSC